MANNNTFSPIEVDSLLPHRPPMLLVDRIISIDDDAKSSTVETTVKKEFPFIDNENCLHGEALIEIMAQASAAQHGYNLERDGKKDALYRCSRMMNICRGSIICGKI